MCRLCSNSNPFSARSTIAGQRACDVTEYAAIYSSYSGEGYMYISNSSACVHNSEGGNYGHRCLSWSRDLPVEESRQRARRERQPFLQKDDGADFSSGDTLSQELPWSIPFPLLLQKLERCLEPRDRTGYVTFVGLASLHQVDSKPHWPRSGIVCNKPRRGSHPPPTARSRAHSSSSPHTILPQCSTAHGVHTP